MIAIITDSTAGFTRDEALKHNLIVLPMTFTVGNREYSEKYLDEPFDEPVTNRNILSCSTASTNIQNYFHAFDTLTRRGFDVLCITISARLSSAYTNAVTAKDMIKTGKMEIIDSKMTAGGLYLLTMKANELLKSGVPFEMLYENLTEAREEMGVAFSVDDISALRKSGRIGLVSQSIGTFLNLRPVFLIKRGTVVSHSVARGIKSQLHQLFNCIPQNAKKVIVHCKKGNPAADELVSMVKSAFDNIEVRDFTNVLTVHVNNDTIGVAWSLI